MLKGSVINIKEPGMRKKVLAMIATLAITATLSVATILRVRLDENNIIINGNNNIVIIRSPEE